ncbi:MAG TPA: site-2 protease family protein [Blastocatellia bacterium]|nr:site-2 protease family protein [Blastocatellia bacterium]
MVSLLYYAIVFVIVLGAMIVIHEFGHFIVAKFFGVRVDVFSVGFGKRLWGVKRGDTDYRISLIPLGGYVKMAGENLGEEVTGAPDEFTSKPKWQRLCIAFAGPAMNVLTALAIPTALAMMHHEVPAYLDRPAIIKAVEPNSPAEKTGLQTGDLIVRIDGVENPEWRDIEDTVAVNPDQNIPLAVNRGGEVKQLALHVEGRPVDQEKIGYAGFKPEETRIVVKEVKPGEPAEAVGLKVGDQIIGVNGNRIEQSGYGIAEVVQAIKGSGGQPVTLTVKRGNETLDLRATPALTGDVWLLGFGLEVSGIEMVNQRLSLIAALKYSVDTNLRILDLTKTALSQVFVGKRSARDTLTGPVGIAQIVGQAAQRGPEQVIELMAILSLNLGIFNLLPIPVLDGGLIFMLLLESLLGVFGLPLTLRIKERMMQVGFVMLMLLMGFVIFNDISKRIPWRTAAPQTEQARPANK